MKRLPIIKQLIKIFEANKGMMTLYYGTGLDRINGIKNDGLTNTIGYSAGWHMVIH